MITVLGAQIESIEDILPGYSPPDALRGYWEDMRSFHGQTEDAMRRWVAQEILSPQVVKDAVRQPLTSRGRNRGLVFMSIQAGSRNRQIAGDEGRIFETRLELGRLAASTNVSTIGAANGTESSIIQGVNNGNPNCRRQ